MARKVAPVQEPDRLITIKRGMELLSQSRESFYRLEKTIKDFPKRVYPNGPNSKPRLVLSEVEAYIERRVKARDREARERAGKAPLGRPRTNPPPAKEPPMETSDPSVTR